MPLDPDDPAREKIAELRASKAGKDEIMAALDTYQVDASYLVKALSPGHARLIVAEMIEHMIEVHAEPGTFVLTNAFANAEPIPWLDGPLFGGTEMNG